MLRIIPMLCQNTKKKPMKLHKKGLWGEMSQSSVLRRWVKFLEGPLHTNLELRRPLMIWKEYMFLLRSRLWLLWVKRIHRMLKRILMLIDRSEKSTLKRKNLTEQFKSLITLEMSQTLSILSILAKDLVPPAISILSGWESWGTIQGITELLKSWALTNPRWCLNIIWSIHQNWDNCKRSLITKEIF